MPEFNGGETIINRLIKESESIVVIQRQLRLSFLFNELILITLNAFIALCAVFVFLHLEYIQRYSK